MLAAARDIIRIAEAVDAALLDPLTVQWARDLIAFNPHFLQPSPLQDAIEALWDEDPTKGMTSPEVVAIVGHPKVTQTTLSHMVRNHRLAVWRAGRLGTYFLTERARDAAVARAPSPKEPQPLRIPRIKVADLIPQEFEMPKPKIDLARRETTAFNPADELLGAGAIARSRAVKAPPGPAITPKHIKVQVIPTGKDHRFSVNLPAGAGEFGQEWARLRGEG